MNPLVLHKKKRHFYTSENHMLHKFTIFHTWTLVIKFFVVVNSAVKHKAKSSSQDKEALNERTPSLLHVSIVLGTHHRLTTLTEHWDTIVLL